MERLTRDRIIRLVRSPPIDTTLDDPIEQPMMLSRIGRRIARLDAGIPVAHKEAKWQLGL